MGPARIAAPLPALGDGSPAWSHGMPAMIRSVLEERRNTRRKLFGHKAFRHSKAQRQFPRELRVVGVLPEVERPTPIWWRIVAGEYFAGVGRTHFGRAAFD